jgi:hypothetical protein
MNYRVRLVKIQYLSKGQKRVEEKEIENKKFVDMNYIKNLR